MKSKKRIKQLEKEIAAIKKIVSKSKITLTDENNPNVQIVLSASNGDFSTDRVTRSESVQTDNITNQN